MKKIVLSISLAILLGSTFALIFYTRISNKEKMVSSVIDNKGYAIQIGVFENIENAYKLSELYNGIVVADNNKYRVYTAIVMDNKTLSLLKNYFNNKRVSYYVKQIDIPEKLVQTIRESETLLSATSENNYEPIIKNILKEYEKYSVWIIK